MSFDEYTKLVFEGLDKWIKMLYNGSITEANDLKESVGDLVAGFKDNFPRRRKEIDMLVEAHMAARFKEYE